MRTEGTPPHFQRASRTGVSPSRQVFVQLTSFLAFLLPALTQGRKGGIKKRRGTRSLPGRWSGFLFEDARDTLATDPDASG
jgi:hypothetical protein